MNKIIICNIPMKEIKEQHYKVRENMDVLCDRPVRYVINALANNILKEGDTVKVMLLKLNDEHGFSDINVQKYKDELESFNASASVNIEYKVIEADFDESQDTQEKIFKSMINELAVGSEIYCDITYGPKSLPIIIFSVLNFAEKFFDADIMNIVYGKVDFSKDSSGKTVVSNPEIVDMTALYCLNSITNVVECSNSDDALLLVDKIMSL